MSNARGPTYPEDARLDTRTKATLSAVMAVAAAVFAARTAAAQISAPASQPSVIYGTDDRLDIYEVADPAVLDWASSTCGLVNDAQLIDNGDGTYGLITEDYLQGPFPPCPGEPFADQPVAPWCSAFVVGDDLIATAGHCFYESYLGTVRFVFGFKMLNATTALTTLTESQVYTGVELLGHQFSDEYDYAVVRVDRPITAPGAYPLPLRRSGSVPVGTNLSVIGHPASLPLKAAVGPGPVVRANGSPGFFVASLDTYGGNSGSPVFDAATGLVEGILVRGETDWDFSAPDCFTSNVVPEDGGRGEDVSKTTTFTEFIPESGEGEGAPQEDHSADIDGNGHISLSELLRVIQFFNSTGYHCDAGTEDGYSPGAEDQACAQHTSDYRPADWLINLSELLRLIQLYNMGPLIPCLEGEDGFCPASSL